MRYNKKKPGVVIYFELRGAIALLTNSHKGILFDAILAYAQDGTYPDLPPKLQPLWPMIQCRLEMDSRRYDLVVTKRKYAAYVRWAKQHEETPIPFQEWMYARGYEEYPDEEEEFATMQHLHNVSAFAKTLMHTEPTENTPPPTPPTRNRTNQPEKQYTI